MRPVATTGISTWPPLRSRRVVPAAHYQCGGVRTDLWARTDLPGLLAVGEVACTGLHGANRLASNSLLEGLVFAHQAVEVALEGLGQQALPESGFRTGIRARPSTATSVVVSHNWDEIRRLMWNYVGIVRSDKRLERARRRLMLLRDEIRQYYWDTKLTPDLIELRNIADVAWLTVQSAGGRKESRGLHYTLDHLETLPRAEDSLIKQGRL